MGEGNGQAFKTKNQMANRHTEKCSDYPAVRKIQIKNHMEIPLNSNEINLHLELY